MSEIEVISLDAASKKLSAKCKSTEWLNFPPSILTKEFEEPLKFYKKIHVREDDIFITGFPRSGTTRLQELVWLIVNNFDYKTALEYDSDARCLFFDIPIYSLKLREKRLGESIDDMPSPRLIKTHLPVQFLPDELWIKKPKIFYICRDVKDVAISYYHLLRDSHSTTDCLEDFMEDFLNDRNLYAPYRETRQNYLNIPHYENIMYLTYEGMSVDLDGNINNIAKFLGKSITIEKRRELKEHLKFENMKNNSATNNKKLFENIRALKKQTDTSSNFIRKGKIGGYREEMSQELIDRFNEWNLQSDKLNQGYLYKSGD